MERNKFLEAGRVLNTHGLHGEIKVEPWTDSPDTFSHFQSVYVAGKAYDVVSCRLQGSFVLLCLSGVDDINAAMVLKGKILTVPREAVPLPPGGFFLADLKGLRVETESGEFLGTLTEVLERPGSNIYAVKGEREILIPAVDAFVLKTDVEAGQMTVRLIEGM